jgi:pyridoxamine 5'-phosphate oxidase
MPRPGSERENDRGVLLGWASDQSEPLESRAALEAQLRQRAADLGLVLAGGGLEAIETQPPPIIPRPPHWGGIRVWASRIELWIEGADRIHDRAVWTRELASLDAHSFSTTPWSGTRLQP